MFPYKMATIDSGFAFVNSMESLGLGFIAGCFLVGVGFLMLVGVGFLGCGAWFLNHSISCPKQLSLKIKFIV